MCSIIGIAEFINYNKEYNTFYDTIRRSIPKVGSFLIGVAPVYLGFMFLAKCLFWRSDKFATMPLTSMSLFALLNGDSVFDVLSETSELNMVFGHLFCYAFFIFFVV